jgi:DNA-binding NarL/FixJ family response regulator
VDATSARTHIQHLVAMGISVNAIALAAGLSHPTVGELASGAHPRAHRHTMAARAGTEGTTNDRFG